LPNGEEPDYFGRLRALANSKKLTITKITPYYGEGLYSESATNDSAPKWIVPIAELEGLAELEGSNVAVRIFAPLSTSEVNRLLTKPSTR
jgi:hypothetical protein